MRKWTRWQDWVAVAAGLYAALATTWTKPAGASVALMIIFGVLLIIAGLWNLASPDMPWLAWVQAIIAALLFISPWIGVYANQAGTAWTSWICGGVGIIVSVWAIQPTMQMHRHEPIAH